jgi:hypothetical protein
MKKQSGKSVARPAKAGAKVSSILTGPGLLQARDLEDVAGGRAPTIQPHAPNPSGG